ncbi:MAG: carbohydrate kinase family protein [Thermodesulfobacteriota bacterium]
MKEKRINEDVQVVGLGQACIDCLGRLDTYPEEDGKVELNDLHFQCGGPASTALVALSRFGIKTSFLGSISDDAWGIEIAENLKREDVGCSLLKVTPGHTSQFAFISITKEGGNRTIFWHRGSVPHLKAADVDLSCFPKAEILHIDGLMIEASEEAARQARQRGLTVVLDAGTMREGSLELASMVDVLIASERFAEPLTGRGAPPEQALKLLRRLGPKEVVITRGRNGSIGLSGVEVLVQDAFAVKAKDTTGAGDVYHGGYLYGLLKGWNMRRCMRFASAAAALKCREVGAQKGIPYLDEVIEFLTRFD